MIKKEAERYIKYSIVIPVYNAEDTVASCVDSIFRTGLNNFEILLVNDGSSDHSEEICKKLSDIHSMINYVYQQNSGVSVARNNGIRHAKGTYILFCDSDDLFEPDCFKEIDDILTDDIDLLIYGIRFVYYHNGFCYRKDDLIYPQEGEQTVEIWSNNLEEMYNYNVLSSVWNKIYRKDIIIKNNLNFDITKILLEDLMFSVTYLAYSNKIYFLDRVAYRYKQSEDEHNAQNRLNKIPSLNFMMNDIRKCLVDTNSIIMEKTGCRLSGMDKLCYQIYYMLVSQKLYYATSKQMKQISTEVLESAYCDANQLAEAGTKILALYQNIKRKKIWKIRIYNIYCQLRHFFAMKYKCYMCKRGRKNEH